MPVPYDNVRTIKRFEKPNDTLWPTNNFDSVAYLLQRQQGIPVQTYAYALKADIAGEAGCITTHKNGDVSYYIANNKAVGQSTVARWVKENRTQLSVLGQGAPPTFPFVGDLFGKTITLDGRLIFVCYYARPAAGGLFTYSSPNGESEDVRGWDPIILNAPWIDQFALGSKGNILNGAAVAAPVEQIAYLIVDNEKQTIMCNEVARAQSPLTVGFPIGLYKEALDAPELSPFIATNPILMRYSAFYHQNTLRRGK